MVLTKGWAVIDGSDSTEICIYSIRQVASEYYSSQSEANL
jgi:hypothetical protein